MIHFLLNKLCNSYLEHSIIYLYISKPSYLTTLITDNPFITLQQKNTILLIIYKIKKYYNAFKVFEFLIYKQLHIKRSSVEYDLGYTLLTDHTEDKKIDIIEDNMIYTFYIPDIIKIIMNSILYQEGLFSLPMLPKNPHTNLPFSISNLYTIYFKLMDSRFTIPILIQYFYKYQFNLSDFKTNCESILRNIHLQTYYQTFSLDEKYEVIITMLHTFKQYSYKLKIHSSFSKKLVVDAFHPLLYDYGITQYSYCPAKKMKSRLKIKQFLKEFQNKHTYFGRIKYNTCYAIK